MMENDKEKFIPKSFPKPDEIEFGLKYSQAVQAGDEEEQARLEKEYDAQCAAYFAWLDEVGKRNRAKAD